MSDYSILEKLGEGGMGQVFAARQRSLNRKVALKTLHADALEDPDLLERFQREARILCDLSHPGIVAVYDSGLLDGRPFFAMELIEGEPLSARLERVGRLDLPAALPVLEEIAAALVYLHGRGVVHRDLKPRNLLLTEREGQDHVVLVDFGLAWIDAAKALTRTGSIVGTVSYLPPEVLTGGVAGPAQDVWAFGLIAYEILAGECLFQPGSMHGIMTTIAAFDRESLEGRLAPVPAEAHELLVRCLDPDPGARPDAGDLGHILDRLRKGPARRSGRRVVAPAPARRGRRPAIPALVLGAGLFLGLGALATRDRVPGTGPPSPVSGSPGTAGSARERDALREIVSTFSVADHDRFLMADFQDPLRRAFEVTLGSHSRRFPAGGGPGRRALFTGLVPDTLYWVEIRTDPEGRRVLRVPVATRPPTSRAPVLQTLYPWATVNGEPGRARLPVAEFQRMMDDNVARAAFFDSYQVPQMLPALTDWLDAGAVEVEHLDDLAQAFARWKERDGARKLLQKLPSDLENRHRVRLASLIATLGLEDLNGLVESWYTRDRDPVLGNRVVDLVGLRPDPSRSAFVLDTLEILSQPGPDDLRVAIACDPAAAARRFRRWVASPPEGHEFLLSVGIQGLSRIESEREAFLQYLEGDVTDFKAMEAFRALARRQDPAAADWLARQLPASREDWRYGTNLLFEAIRHGIPVTVLPGAARGRVGEEEPLDTFRAMHEAAVLAAVKPPPGALEDARERLRGAPGWLRDLAIWKVARWRDPLAAPLLERLAGSPVEDPHGVALWSLGQVQAGPAPADFVTRCLAFARTAATKARGIFALVAAHQADETRTRELLDEMAPRKDLGPVVTSLHSFLRSRHTRPKAGARLIALLPASRAISTDVILEEGDGCLLRVWGFAVGPDGNPRLSFTSGDSVGGHGLSVYLGDTYRWAENRWGPMIARQRASLVLGPVRYSASGAILNVDQPIVGLILLEVVREGAS